MIKLFTAILIAVFTLSFFSVTTLAQNKDCDAIYDDGNWSFSKKVIEEPDLRSAIWQTDKKCLINSNEILTSSTLKATYVYICEDNEWRQSPYYHYDKKCKVIKGCPKSGLIKMKLSKAVKNGYLECQFCMIGD